jgi:hypothetical protein
VRQQASEVRQREVLPAVPVPRWEVRQAQVPVVYQLRVSASVIGASGTPWPVVPREARPALDFRDIGFSFQVHHKKCTMQHICPGRLY